VGLDKLTDKEREHMQWGADEVGSTYLVRLRMNHDDSATHR